MPTISYPLDMSRFRGKLDEDGQGGYILCVVEGCPRASEAGQDAMCGLAKIYGLSHDDGDNMKCGSAATVELWYQQGVFDEAEDE